MSEFNIDSLLDNTLDALAELPEMRPYIPGAHQCVMNWIQPTKERPTTIGIKFKLLQTVEQKDPTEPPMNPGTECTISFKLDNEYGQGAFRNVMKSLAENYGAGTNRELMEKSEGAEVLIITSLKTGKKKDDGSEAPKFTNLVELKVV